MGRARARRLNLIALVVLLVALAAGLGLRVHAQQATPNVQHDEAWSYASAAGRLGPFIAAMGGDQTTSLTGRWVPASQWQRFWTSTGLSDVRHIATGLSSNDVHPPLYFGLLHGWLLVTGMHIWAGRALNLVFATFTILAIFGLARALRFQRLEGALVALVWAVSPAVVSISSIARQYDLVGLTTVLFVWGLVDAVRARGRERGDGGHDDGLERARGDARAGAPEGARWPYLLWLAAATAAALLTHYQAVLLVAGAVIYVLAGPFLPARVARRGSWWPPLLSLAAGTLIAAALAPGWRSAFGHERSKLDSFSGRVLSEKVAAIGDTLARFVGLPAATMGIVVAAVAVLLLVLLAVPRTRRALTQRVRAARPGWWTVLFFLLVTAGGICLQNLLFLSMPPRISARYLAMAWPFVAFLPLLLFGLWPRARYALTAGLCLLVLLPATIAAPLLVGSADRLPLGRLADAHAVLIDNVGVGELPRFLWSVPPGARVFAGTQEQLLADKTAWTTAPLGDRAYYVSILRSGGVVWRRNRILANLRKTHDVTLLGTNGMAEVYAVTPKAGQ
ncbi:MAG TPA: glycosyltransferase family 39 protein [Thermoleophilia bacterium]|nr:glycosyltransferase family 39 protein [Thermoleophilia bacterium]